MELIVKIIIYAIFSYITSVAHYQYVTQVASTVSNAVSSSLAKDVNSTGVGQLTSLALLPVRLLINIMILSILVTVGFILFKTTLLQFRANMNKKSKLEGGGEPEGSDGGEKGGGKRGGTATEGTEGTEAEVKNILNKVLEEFYKASNLELYNIFLSILLFNTVYHLTLLLLFQSKVLSFKKLGEETYAKSIIHYYFTGFYLGASVLFWNPPVILSETSKI
jgi:hypothetical protein